MSLLKNPMILIAGVSMILVFGMPYIMDNSKFILPAPPELNLTITSSGS